MLELFSELGMLPLWGATGIVALCLVAAWFRKSHRAATAALTVAWVAGLFYMPYFLYQYGRHRQFQEEIRAGEEIDPEVADHFRDVERGAWTYATTLCLTAGTYLLLKPRRTATVKRRNNLEVEYLKAIEAKRAKKSAEPAGAAQNYERADVEQANEQPTDDDSQLRGK